MFFTEEQVADLHTGLEEAQANFRAIRTSYIAHQFRDPRAREFATHGFGRRLGHLIHSVERVFELLPPHLDEIPDRRITIEATTHIQAFVMNAFGCCDNLAWVWVSEKEVRRPNGGELLRSEVGFAPHQRAVRASYHPEFVAYLDEIAQWFELLKDFRDSLAHRIPLYVPPYVVDPNDADAYARLGEEAKEALRNGNLAEYDELLARQKGLGSFCPIMTHSFTERAGSVIFHAQLLADFSTVHALAEKLLAELNRE